MRMPITALIVEGGTWDTNFYIVVGGNGGGVSGVVSGGVGAIEG